VTKHEGQELWDVIFAIYDKHRKQSRISPAWLATEGMVAIDFSRSTHELGYIGCHLQLRQIARQFCGQHFDPIHRQAPADDLFPETLQERYPVKTPEGEDPEYILLEEMDDDDFDFNIERMERRARSLLKHVDALRAYKRTRKRTA
jgi:hypothetical protein